MENFTYSCPTHWVFGRGTQAQVGELTERFAGKNATVLLHFGGNAIKRIGLYDTTVSALRERGIRFVELGGVVPNPRLELVREGNTGYGSLFTPLVYSTFVVTHLNIVL